MEENKLLACVLGKDQKMTTLVYTQMPFQDPLSSRKPQT